jgi:hypothetical protein
MQMLFDYFITQDNAVNNFPMKISVVLLNEKHETVNAVSVTMESWKQQLQTLVTKLPEEQVVKKKFVSANSSLEFDMTGISNLNLRFSKSGYYPVEKRIDKGGIVEKELENAPLDAKNYKLGDGIKWLKIKYSGKPYEMKMTIVMRKIPPLPKVELWYGDFTLSYEKDGDEPAVRKGWKLIDKPKKSDKKNEENEALDDPEEYMEPDDAEKAEDDLRVSEDGGLPESIKFEKTSDMDLYVERDEKDKRKLWLVSNREDTGFVLVPDAEDPTYLAIAPEKGYVRRMAFTASDDDAPPFYCYWKLHGKYYGKMEVEVDLCDRTLDENYSKEEDFGPSYLQYRVFIKTVVNPSGSRNVATKEDDFP